MLRPINRMRRAIWTALSHDVLTQSKSAAYSAILSLFPALLVVTTVLALLPETDSLTGEVRGVLTDFLPGDTMRAVHTYFQERHVRSVQTSVSAVLVSLFGSMGVMSSFMEGFRRAYDLPKGSWSGRHQKLVALSLIPSCLLPMVLATVLVAFGYEIESWIVANADHAVQTYVLVMWRVTRWVIGVGTTASVLAVLYHFGTPREQRWHSVVPGALGAAVLWFMVTVSFGWYVTRFADYSVVYGPLGTAVATLVWLYITAFSVLIGAEYNAQDAAARETRAVEAGAREAEIRAAILAGEHAREEKAAGEQAGEQAGAPAASKQAEDEVLLPTTSRTG
jgi:membrane protein